MVSLSLYPDLDLHQPVLHLDNALNLQVERNAIPL